MSQWPLAGVAPQERSPLKIRHSAWRATRQDGTLRFGSSDLSMISYVRSITTAVCRSLAANLVPFPGVPSSTLALPDVRQCERTGYLSARISVFRPLAHWLRAMISIGAEFLSNIVPLYRMWEGVRCFCIMPADSRWSGSTCGTSSV